MTLALSLAQHTPPLTCRTVVAAQQLLMHPMALLVQRATMSEVAPDCVLTECAHCNEGLDMCKKGTYFKHTLS